MSPMFEERIEVECHSGYRVYERPTAFTLRGRRLEVEGVVDRWYEGGVHPDRPRLLYFRVQAVGGGTFLLRYNALFDAWSTTLPSEHG